MPVYNCESYIAEAIESILNQTYIYFELIIIDDYSTDGTLAVISRYEDPRIRLVKKERNTGLIASLNTGIDMAIGKYIARMDGDDISLQNRFETQVNFMETNPHVVLCGTWFKIIPTDVIIKHPISHNDIKIALLEYCAFGHSTVMLRRSVIVQESLKYLDTFVAAEDFELWTRIITKGLVANIPQVLLYYRQHAGQVSNKMSSIQYDNSCLCKRNMLCQPLVTLTQKDKYLSSIVIQNKLINSKQTLDEVLDWLDRLIKLNKVSQRDENYEGYINLKKRNLIVSFYNNVTQYNLKILYDVVKLNVKNKLKPSILESSKFIIKCVIFYNKSAL